MDTLFELDNQQRSTEGFKPDTSQMPRKIFSEACCVSRRLCEALASRRQHSRR